MPQTFQGTKNLEQNLDSQKKQTMFRFAFKNLTYVLSYC